MSTNIDPQELEKFAKTMQNWWDLNGEFKPLHEINPLRLGFIKQHASLKNKKILDVGCGGGILSEALAKEGAVVTAIDASEVAVSAAEEHLTLSKLPIDYRLERVETLAANEPASYDVVTCMEMLEHVPEPKQIISACGALLKPGGSLFVATINRSLKSFFTTIVGAEYILNLLPKGTHRYEKLIKPGEITAWARKVNLTPKHAAGLSYNLLTKEFSLTDSTAANYMLHLALDVCHEGAD